MIRGLVVFVEEMLAMGMYDIPVRVAPFDSLIMKGVNFDAVLEAKESLCRWSSGESMAVGIDAVAGEIVICFNFREIALRVGGHRGHSVWKVCESQLKWTLSPTKACTPHRS